MFKVIENDKDPLPSKTPTNPTDGGNNNGGAAVLAIPLPPDEDYRPLRAFEEAVLSFDDNLDIIHCDKHALGHIQYAMCA